VEVIHHEFWDKAAVVRDALDYPVSRRALPLSVEEALAWAHSLPGVSSLAESSPSAWPAHVLIVSALPLPVTSWPMWAVAGCSRRDCKTGAFAWLPYLDVANGGHHQ
jgi:hypothetical protein